MLERGKQAIEIRKSLDASGEITVELLKSCFCKLTLKFDRRGTYNLRP